MRCDKRRSARLHDTSDESYDRRYDGARMGQDMQDDATRDASGDDVGKRCLARRRESTDAGRGKRRDEAPAKRREDRRNMWQ